MDALKEDLRENHRLKFGTDYCWTLKYNEVRVMCHKVYKETISEVAIQHGINVVEWFVYG